MLTGSKFVKCLASRAVTCQCRKVQAKNPGRYVRCISQSSHLRFADPGHGQKPTFVRDKVHVNIGTIGHVNHGKTTLTSAITQVLAERNESTFRACNEIDKGRDEQARGLSIHNTTLDYSTDTRHYAHFDCPGHEDYVKNTLIGLVQMDGGVLVVSATEGTEAQTREHLMLAKQMGIEHIVVYISKADSSDPEIVEVVEMEVRELLEEVGFDSVSTPIISGSALNSLEGESGVMGRESIERLLQAVDTHIPAPHRDTDSPFYMPIDQIFSITGRGTVVTGTVRSGTLRKGQDCVIVGYDQEHKTIVTNTESFYHMLEWSEAGDRLNALVKGLKKDDLRKGHVLAQPGAVSMHNNLQVQIEMVAANRGGREFPVTPHMEPQMHCSTWDLPVMLKLDEGSTELIPGQKHNIRLLLRKKMVIDKGYKFVLRDEKLTMATGIVTELLPNLTTSQLEAEKKSGKKTKRR